MPVKNLSRIAPRIAAVAMFLILAAGGLDALAGKAARTRPSGSGTVSIRVSGTASYGYGGTYYYPSAWYGGYGWYGGLWGWPYGYHWYGPAYGYPAYRMVTMPITPDGKAPAFLETDIRPKKTHLFLDGDDLGKVKYFNGNWDRLPLSPGLRKLEFRTPGYRTLRVELDAEPGRFYRLDYSMEKGEGEDPRSVRLPAPEKETIAPPERGIRSGLMKITVLPADAAVYLDGEFLGRGDELSRLHGALPVAIGIHRIEIVRPGYEARTLEINVTEGEPLRLDLDLKQEQN